jgi:hypothetical protein
VGPQLGRPGPDQGFALHLVRVFEDRLVVRPPESREDAIEGCVGVALARASLFGRAPVVHDLTVAFTIWGFLDEHPPADLVMHRRRYFEGVANPHHYVALRTLVDAVPDDSLRKTPGEVTRLHGASWRSLLPLPADG